MLVHSSGEGEPPQAAFEGLMEVEGETPQAASEGAMAVEEPRPGERGGGGRGRTCLAQSVLRSVYARRYSVYTMARSFSE